MNKIKVLIVDDSALVRQTMSDILSSDPQIQVIGTAANPIIAVAKLEEEVPDVITLDLEMPQLDGLSFLEKLMRQHPLPVVICSSMAETNSDNYLRALALGAVEIIQKPKLGTKQFLEEARVNICDIVKAASKARLRPPSVYANVEPKLTADAVLAKPKHYSTFQTTEKIIVIGSSTGGTEALRYILPRFPRDCPGIVIVQHMPETFTKSFAQSLDSVSDIVVKEAQNDETVLRGHAYIAPGNKHVIVKRQGARYYVEVKDGPLVNRHRPSVDVLFRSAARYVGPNAVAALLTGMGDDGARGLLELKEAGAYTIAQDEESSIVFGMPRVGIELGAALEVRSLTTMNEAILKAVHRVSLQKK